jgi:hypothetical protein
MRHAAAVSNLWRDWELILVLSAQKRWKSKKLAVGLL